MVIVDIPITEEDVISSSWEEVIAPVEEKECDKYTSLFEAKVKEGAVNIKNEAIFKLLGVISTFRLVSESGSEPFMPLYQFEGSRGLVPGDLVQNEIDILKMLLVSAKDPEIRARISDVLWLVDKTNRERHKTAQVAIEEYLKSANNLENPDSWPASFERIERAFRIALSLNNHDVTLKVANQIELIVKKYKDNISFFSGKLMELLLEIKVTAPEDFIAISDALAVKSESEKSWDRARFYWMIKARWCGVSGNPDGEKLSKVAAAEAYVKEARSSSSASAASTYLTRAIEALRRAGGSKDRVEELRAELIPFQESIRTELKTISSEVDITEMVERNKKRVMGKTFYEAIKIFALMRNSPDILALEKEVKRRARDFPLSFILTKTVVSPSGKIVAKVPGMGSGDNGDLIRAEMITSSAREHMSLAVNGVIEPARREIYREHPGTPQDFLEIVSDNPFIPPGRELLYARALSAGLRGDFVEFASIAVPQIENSIRYLLSLRGRPTSSMDSEGIEKELDLNSLLYDSEVKAIFGENLIFDMQVLLVAHNGCNLRNIQAHGLIDLDGFYSISVSYLWWQLIHIIFGFLLSQNQAERE